MENSKQIGTPEADRAAFHKEYCMLTKGAEDAIALLKPRLAILLRDLGIKSEPDSRIKDEAATWDKMQRKNCSIHGISDIAGIRVVTAFEDQIYMLAKALQNQPGIHVVRVKDYIYGPDDSEYSEYVDPETWTRYGPKEFGYSSLQMVVVMEVWHIDHKEDVKVEVQFRDITMHSWAVLDTAIRYRFCKCGDLSYEQRAELDICPEVKEILPQLSEDLRSVRKRAISLRDYPRESQGSK